MYIAMPVPGFTLPCFSHQYIDITLVMIRRRKRRGKDRRYVSGMLLIIGIENRHEERSA
jgi:hypothetical protein